MKQPLVSIIIANWNGGEIFRNCLSSLSKIDYENYELIVVDNGSIDQSSDYIKDFSFKKVTVLKNKTNVGFAPANNQGYEQSTGEFVLFLNNDTKTPKDFLYKLVTKALENPNFGVIQPKIYMMDTPQYLDNAGSFFTNIGFLKHWGFGKKDSDEFNSEREVFSAKGACMLVRRDVIEKVDLFDKDFISYFEESDFCWRVWLAGYKVLFFPDAHIYHKVGFTIQRLDVSNINFNYYKNRIASLIKNLSLERALVIVPLHMVVSVAIACAFLLRGKPQNALMIFNAFIWNISYLSQTLQKRKKIQKQRAVSDKELFKNLAVPIDWSAFFNDFKRVEKDLTRKIS